MKKPAPLESFVFNMYIHVMYLKSQKLELQKQSLEFAPQTKTATQFSSVTQLCPTLCDRMECSTPDLPVHHQLPEFTQTHVH